jgi:hypothetical protein
MGDVMGYNTKYHSLRDLEIPQSNRQAYYVWNLTEILTLQ